MKILILLLILPTLSFSGTKQSEAIRKKIKANLIDINSCYSSFGKSSKGKVVVDWTVNDQGRVQNPSINKSKSSLHNSKLNACIIEMINGWRLPPTPNGQVIKISYPFLFSKLPKNSKKGHL